VTRGVELTNREEVLNRQVHPVQYDLAKGVLSAAFTPTPSHDFKLSTLRERVGPEEAFRRHTQGAGLASLGTWPVEVGHACDQGLTCLDDAGLDRLPDDHASVDFSALSSRGKKQQAGRKLAERANELGPLHVPTK